ncbi:hypothetical protein CAP35_06445 [Chitinophagaceae bacterium IBVUCB1]|nr:hypothetical protein CAP35_06445 [Chitinophagaceae bacterium IBVUCB1]
MTWNFQFAQRVIIILLIALAQNVKAQLPPYVPSDSLQFFYSFDGPVPNPPFSHGKLQDLGPRGYNGTPSTFTNPIVIRWESDRHGNIDGAFRLNGNERLTTSTYKGVFDANDRTISIWFYLDSIARDTITYLPPYAKEKILMTYGYGSNHEFTLSVAGENIILTTGYDGWNNYSKLGVGTSQQAPLFKVKSKTWHHLVVCYSVAFGGKSSNCKVYVDNVEYGFFNLLYSSNLDVKTLLTGDVVFGYNYSKSSLGDTTYNFIGKIDEIGIWSRVLSRTEMSHLYTSTSTRIEKNEKVQINIYPNPTNKFCVIKCPFTIKKLELLNSNGQIVLIKYPNEMHYEIDVSTLGNGVNTLIINTEYKRKIIKN